MINIGVVHSPCGLHGRKDHRVCETRQSQGAKKRQRHHREDRPSVVKAIFLQNRHGPVILPIVSSPPAVPEILHLAAPVSQFLMHRQQRTFLSSGNMICAGAQTSRCRMQQLCRPALDAGRLNSSAGKDVAAAKGGTPEEIPEDSQGCGGSFFVKCTGPIT